MNINTILDPIAQLKENNDTTLLESTIHSVIARLRSGKPIDPKFIGVITNNEGKPLSYDEVLPHVPKELLNTRTISLLRQATNQYTIDQDKNVGQNVFSQTVQRR